jgi:sortase A
MTGPDSSPSGTSKVRPIRTRWIEIILLGIGLTLLGVWGVDWIYRTVSARNAVAKFEIDQAQAAAGNPPQADDPATGSKVDFALWSPKRAEQYLDSVKIKADRPLAVLRIPDIQLAVPVYNDTDDLTLNRGVGRIIGTAQVGGGGNLGIAGHRDGFFRSLKDIAVGAEIDLDRVGKTDTYVVDKITIVGPEDVSVLKPTEQPSLTLVTCYPFYFVGSAPQRYIVHATVKTLDRSQGQISSTRK